MIGDDTVERKGEEDGSSRLILVPIVERGLREADLVHVAVDEDKENALRGALRSAADRILVRADGSQPTPSRLVFTRMGAPLAATPWISARQAGNDAAKALKRARR